MSKTPRNPGIFVLFYGLRMYLDFLLKVRCSTD
jgi:hypothetical protein